MIEGTFIKSLKQMGLLFPGSVVNGKVLENIFECKYQKDDWNFLGKYLTLKTQIEAHGYFVTQQDIEAPGFRILKTEEMAEHASKKLAKAMGISFKTAVIMANHDSSKLEEREKKHFNSMRQKAANMALAQQRILMEDFFLD